MNVRYLILIAIWLSLQGPVVAQPDSANRPAGELCLSLNGVWQFSTNEFSSGVAPATIIVPGNWDTLPAYANYSGKGWYQRTFIVPESWRSRYVRLQFEAVYNEAQIWLNGQLLGRHFGGYTPFEFEVKDNLKYGETNTIRVCADNTYHRGAWWPWGGISRPVTLFASHEVRIIWQHIRSEPDLNTGKAKLTVQYKLVNSSDVIQTVELKSSIEGISDSPLIHRVTLGPHSDRLFDIATTLAKKEVRLWDFDHPNLYTLTTELSHEGILWDTKTDCFGIRKIEITPDGMLLNGERIRLPGFNRISDSSESGNTEPDAVVQRDVDLMKSCGAEMSRLMHVPQAPNLLNYLDAKGMLIFEEIPVWQDDPQMRPDNAITKQWLTEMIDRDYNHPCIIGWSVGNELPKGRNAYVDSMLNFIRQSLDPQRLCTYVSSHAGDTNESPGTEPIAACDLALVNLYNSPSWYQGFPLTNANDNYITRRLRTIRERWPDKPIFISECGVGQLTNNLQATIPEWDKTWAAIGRCSYVIGASLWSFNDYRSSYQDTGAFGYRTWGVVNDQRQPKAAFNQLRTLFSPVHSLTVTGLNICIVPRGLNEIPSYTLRDYQLKWILFNAVNTVVKTGTIYLPVIKPASNPWHGAIAGGVAVKDAVKVQVSLITPTGYQVSEENGEIQ